MTQTKQSNRTDATTGGCSVLGCLLAIALVLVGGAAVVGAWKLLLWTWNQ